MSNVGEISWGWILGDHTQVLKRPIRKFHVLVVQWRQRNEPKSVNARAELMFWLLNLLLLLTFSLPSPSSLLDLPDINLTAITATIHFHYGE